jgi:hypothetical protein
VFNHNALAPPHHHRALCGGAGADVRALARGELDGMELRRRKLLRSCPHAASSCLSPACPAILAACEKP